MTKQKPLEKHPSAGSGCDKAKELFDVLENELESRKDQILTEEDARFQIIDRILTEVLNWPHGDILTERRAGKGYVDYLIKLAGRNKIIIEAKRQSTTLLDTASDKQATYKVSGPSLQLASDGIAQARDYCLSKGVSYAVLTSGFQWIFFWAIRSDGIEPDEGKAIVFPNLKAIADNFALFYDLLSKEGISENLHVVQLNKAENQIHKIAEHLYVPIDDKDVLLIASSQIARDLRPVFSNFFSIMSDEYDHEMLQECFVESRESRETDVSLRKIAQNLAANIASINSQGAEELKKELANAMATKRGEFVLIIGQKGAGKTTFIGRFFSIVLDSTTRKNCLVVRLDLGKFDTDLETLNKKLLKELRQLLEKELFTNGRPTYEQLQGIFYDEYLRRKEGTSKPLYLSNKIQFDIDFGKYLEGIMRQDDQEYILKLIQHGVRSKKLMPCIIFDNTDQFSQRFQEAVFQFAQSIFTRIDYAFFICPITDRSIWQLSKSGPFQSYPTKQFYLPVPKAGEILNKRVEFLRKKVREQKKNPTTYFLDKGLHFIVDKIETFAAYLEEIFVHEEFVTGKIGKLANFEIRRMLQLSEKVITSPSLSTDELFKAYVCGDKSEIRPDKIDRAIIRGDHNYYDFKTHEYIFNVFQVDRHDITSPLLFLRVLKFLEYRDNNAKGDLGIAYSALEQIQKYFEPMSVTTSTIKNIIGRLYSRRLVESYDPSLEIINEDDKVRVTPSGRVHIELATRNKMYVSNMAVRTPMRSQTVAEEIALYNSKHNTEGYAQIRKTFADYCLNEDKKFIHIPPVEEYFPQKLLTDDFTGYWLGNTSSKTEEKQFYAAEN